MRRDMDLIRSILLAVEANEDPNEFITPRIDGFSELEVCQHIALMEQGGLITARNRSAIGIYYWSAGALTFAGHELLDCARDQNLWDEAKRAVRDACGGVAYRILQSTLEDLIRARINRSVDASDRERETSNP